MPKLVTRESHLESCADRPVNLPEETIKKAEQALENEAKSKVAEIQEQYYKTYDWLKGSPFKDQKFEFTNGNGSAMKSWVVFYFELQKEGVYDQNL